jgi:hypothetical protein
VKAAITRGFFSNGPTINASTIATISGIITQFIGATLMLIYRSTMAQAIEFMTVLERINTVGMAVQLSDSTKEPLKNSPTWVPFG